MAERKTMGQRTCKPHCIPVHYITESTSRGTSFMRPPGALWWSVSSLHTSSAVLILSHENTLFSRNKDNRPKKYNPNKWKFSSTGEWIFQCVLVKLTAIPLRFSIPTHSVSVTVTVLYSFIFSVLTFLCACKHG